MSADVPAVSVVVSTHNRAARLERLIDALRQQTRPAESFEIVIVDNGSTDRTPEVLDTAESRAEPPLRVIRLATCVGPAGARERGWRAARAPVIAFTDDDCEPAPAWLDAGLEAIASRPDGFVQGRTEPNPAELESVGPFTRSVKVREMDHNFPTCNMFFPRSLLERIGGFDTSTFGREPGGEDSDLAWRAIRAGAAPSFAPAALVHHAVNDLGPWGKLKVASRPMRAYAIHPELRRTTFVHGIFWKRSHYDLARALVALVLPRHLLPIRAWLAWPYVRSAWARAHTIGGGPVLTLYYVLHDLVEAWAIVRAALRYRTPMF